MFIKMIWTTNEEAAIFCWYFPTVSCRLHLYNLGDGEAEIRIEEWYGPKTVAGLSDKKRKKVIYKMTKLRNKLRKALDKQGLPLVYLLAPKGSNTKEFIDSTNVVELGYSEYMLRKQIQESSEDYTAEFLKNGIELPEVTLAFCREEDGYAFTGYLAEDSNTPVFQGHMSPYETSWYLYAVEVPEEFRGRRIGTAGMIKLMKLLPEQLELSQTKEQSTQLYLQVGSYNKTALHLYQKLGFEVETEIGYYKI